MKCQLFSDRIQHPLIQPKKYEMSTIVRLYPTSTLDQLKNNEMSTIVRLYSTSTLDQLKNNEMSTIVG